MKAKRILISILTVAALLMIVSCSPRILDEIFHSGISYKVYFYPGDGKWPDSIPTDLKYDEQTRQYYKEVGYQSRVSHPSVNPTPNNSTEKFDYWEYNGTKFNFDMVITSDLALTAIYKSKT